MIKNKVLIIVLSVICMISFSAASQELKFLRGHNNVDEDYYREMPKSPPYAKVITSAEEFVKVYGACISRGEQRALDLIEKHGIDFSRQLVIMVFGENSGVGYSIMLLDDMTTFEDGVLKVVLRIKRPQRSNEVLDSDTNVERKS